MLVQTVFVIVLCFRPLEASTKIETKFLKAYSGNSGCNPNQQDPNDAKVIMHELHLLRHQLETMANDESRRDKVEPLGSVSSRIKQLNFIKGLLSDSVDYSIAKLEAEERHKVQHPGPEFSKKSLDPIDCSGFVKKNFDPIDRSGFGSFVKKDFDTTDSLVFSSIEKKNLDTIDSSQFSTFNQKNVDQVDRSGFSFDKKNYAKEIINPFNQPNFGGFVKKNFDRIDRAGFDNFIKKRNLPSKEIPNVDK